MKAVPPGLLQAIHVKTVIPQGDRKEEAVSIHALLMKQGEPFGGDSEEGFIQKFQSTPCS